MHQDLRFGDSAKSRPCFIPRPRLPGKFLLCCCALSSCQARHLFPEIGAGHRGRGSLLLTPRLDAQNLFARMFADIGNGNLAHPRVLEQLQQTAILPSQISATHVAALKTDLRVETLSHAAGLTAHTAVLLFGSSKFLGCHEQGHSRTTVGLTRSRGVTLLAGPPDRYGLIGMLQILYCYYATGFASLWTAPSLSS